MSGRRAGGWTCRVRHWALPVLSAAAALWLVRGLWGPEPPGGLDTLAHVVRTDFGLREVFGRFHIDGWAPAPGVGSEIFLFYGPGLAMLVGAVRVLSLGLLSTTGAFKVVLAASFAALPLSTVYLARGFGLARRAAALAGVLALGVSSLYGPGIEGVFGLGLVPHQVAAPFTVFGLGAVVRLWLDPGLRRVLPLALSVTAVVLLHPISAFILAVLGGVVVVLMEAERALRDRRRAYMAVRPVPPQAAGRQLVLPGMEAPSPRQAVRWGTGAVLSAAGLTAFWLVPFLAHQDLGGAASGWATPSFTFRLDEVLHGQVLFEPPVGWLVLGGMVAALLIGPGRRPAAMVLAPVAYLLVAHVVKDQYPYNGLAFQLPNRGLGYTGFLAVLPLAAALDQVARRLRFTAWAPATVAVGAGFVIGVWPMTDLVDLTRGSPPRPTMVEAARQIRRLVPEHARFAVERQGFERDATGVESPPFWMALASRRSTVNAFAPETSTAPVPMFVGDSMTEVPPRRRPTGSPATGSRTWCPPHRRVPNGSVRPPASGGSGGRSGWPSSPSRPLSTGPTPPRRWARMAPPRPGCCGRDRSGSAWR